MKKTLILTLSLVLFVSGCFSDKASTATTSTPTDTPREVSVTINNKQQATVLPVSVTAQTLQAEALPQVTPQEKISDADLYKKAYESKNPALCAGISSESLKKVCVTETQSK